jgi:hypothetical protein
MNGCCRRYEYALSKTRHWITVVCTRQLSPRYVFILYRRQKLLIFGVELLWPYPTTKGILKALPFINVNVVRV